MNIDESCSFIFYSYIKWPEGTQLCHVVPVSGMSYFGLTGASSLTQGLADLVAGLRMAESRFLLLNRDKYHVPVSYRGSKYE